TTRVDAPGPTAFLGRPLGFDLSASDPDLGTTLTFSARSLPEGATLDPRTGHFHWVPGPGQEGQYAVTFSVTDGQATVSRTAVIEAFVQPEAPAVRIELTPGFPASPGQKVLVHVLASSLAPVASLTLTADGRRLALDAQGRAEVVPQAPGRIALEATAPDADGLVGRASAVLKVRNPAAQAPPSASLDPLLDGSALTAAADILGTVAGGNIDPWPLDV